MIVKWGIIGASGKWTDQTFIPAIISAQNAEIVAICGRSHDVTKKISEKYNIPFYYTELENLLADMNIDIIWIATSDCFHYEHALACLSAGKHVLIEKPLCQYPFEAAHIYNLASQMNKQIYVGYHNRYNPLHIKYKQMCDDNVFGSIVSVRVTFYIRYDFIKNEWSTLKNNPGGWALSHIGTHLIDLIQWFTSKSTETKPKMIVTCAKLSSPSFQFESEDFCYAVLINESENFIGTIECSTGMESEHVSRFEIHGTKGYVVLNNTFMGSGSFEHKIYGSEKISGLATKVNPYHLQVETISNNIINNSDYMNSDPFSNIVIMNELRNYKN